MYCGIIGTNYCGSTMLSYMLGGSPDVFSTGELTHGNERLRCGDWHKGEDCPFWTDSFKKKIIKNKQLKNNIIKKRAKNIFGASIVVNPDKFPYFYKNSLKNGDSVDFIIILFKTPHAFAYSYLEHQKKRRGVRHSSDVRRKKLLSEACSTYYGIYSDGCKFVESKKIPHIYVSYESLASNPHSMVRRICSKLGAKYSNDMVNYWENSDRLHMVPSGNAGARYQFLNKDKYDRIWESRLDDSHNTYGEQHSRWLLDNYRSISLDEKWKKYLSKDEKNMINNHRKSFYIYKKMIGLSL